MKISTERLPDSQAAITVEVEPELLEKYVQRAYRSTVNRINVPGFRRGKAPRFIVERMVGKEVLVHEGIELLLPDVVREVLKESDVKPIEQPHWEVEQEDPLILKATVSLEPEVELGNYQDIRLTRENPTLDEQQVEALMTRLQEEHAEWVPVDRPAQMDDRVTLDIEGHTLGESLLEGVGGTALVAGQGVKLLNSENVDYLLKPQPDSPLAGLTENIAGITPGEDKEFRLTLPPHYPESELAGKTAVFKVKVHAIREKHLPALDDDFAKTLGQFENLEDCREAIRENLKAGLEKEAEDRLAESIIDAILDGSRVEVPPALIEHEVDRSVERLGQSLGQQGISLESFLKMRKQTEAELRDGMKPTARKRIATSLVLTEVAKAEGIEVTADEIDGEIERLTQSMGGEEAGKARDILNKPDGRQRLGYGIIDRKAMSRLVDLATAEDKPQADGASDPAGVSAATAAAEVTE